MFYIHREEKTRPGRPSKYNSELETTLCDLYGDLTLFKKDIARKSGVRYFTLIHWQRERPLVRVLAGKSVPDHVLDTFERCYTTYRLFMSSTGAAFGGFYQIPAARAHLWRTFRVPSSLCPHVPRAEIEADSEPWVAYADCGEK